MKQTMCLAAAMGIVSVQPVEHSGDDAHTPGRGRQPARAHGMEANISIEYGRPYLKGRTAVVTSCRTTRYGVWAQTRQPR